MLSSPHLVLTYTGCDDSLVFYGLSLLAELTDDSLRLDHRAWGLLFIVERESVLPFINLREPFGAFGDFVYMGYEKGKIFSDIAFDSFGSLDDFVDILG